MWRWCNGSKLHPAYWYKIKAFRNKEDGAVSLSIACKDGTGLHFERNS